MRHAASSAAAAPAVPGVPAGKKKNSIKHTPKSEGPSQSGQAKTQGKKKKFSFTNFLLVLILLVGLGIVAYPTFSDYWNSFHQSRAIAGYAQAVADIDDGEYEAMWQAAVEYNAGLLKKADRWNPSREETEEYESILNVSGTGIIGYIEIPSIKVDLPIYHGTDEAVLQIAVGHIEGSSLPVGGKGTHSVLSGHRGLPSAKLFTNLDKVTKGDVFVVRVLNEKVTYEVDQILIVEPTDTAALAIDPEQDYCTLVTCTPYGVNTHRMLVRGHRIENLKEANAIMATADAQQIDRNIVALCMAVPVLVLLFLRDMISGGKRRKKRLARWERIDQALYGLPGESEATDAASEAPEPRSPLPPVRRVVASTQTRQVQTSTSVTFRLEQDENGRLQMVSRTGSAPARKKPDAATQTAPKPVKGKVTMHVDQDQEGHVILSH